MPSVQREIFIDKADGGFVLGQDSQSYPIIMIYVFVVRNRKYERQAIATEGHAIPCKHILLDQVINVSELDVFLDGLGHDLVFGIYDGIIMTDQFHLRMFCEYAPDRVDFIVTPYIILI